MTSVLQSSRNAQFTSCFAVTPLQVVLITDGINKGQRWDGFSATSTPLGLTAPTTAATTTAAGAGGGASTGVYYIYYRYKDIDGNYSSLSPVRQLTAIALNTFSHTGILASSDSRVTQVEILRSLANASATVYLVTTLTNGTTTYSDTLSDSTLSAATSYAVANADGTTNLQRFNPPPTTRFAIPFFDRVWYFGRATYRYGSVELTNGSASVQGRGTQWTDQMVGWYLYVDGVAVEHSVTAVNTSTQVITLAATYTGTTNLFSAYALRPDKLLRRRIYHSVALEPENVRTLDYVLPSEDGGDYTGGFDHRNYLFITEAGRIWRLFIAAMQGRESENTKPSVGIQHVAYRGAINNRCIARYHDTLYILDANGVYAFDGSAAKPLSGPIQDVFDDQINWAASEWFFAEVDELSQIVVFHVALGESYLPHHAIVYDPESERWECIEDYEWRLGCATTATISGRRQPILGGAAGRFYLREGTLDGTTERTIRGTATSATALTLVDASSDAVLPSSAGATLCITKGPGKGQRRKIIAISSGTMTIDQPWYEQPTSESDYQVGGVTWSAKTGMYSYPTQPTKSTRVIAVAAEPTAEAASLDLRRYLDHDTQPYEHTTDQDLGQGVSITKDSPDAVAQLQRTQTQGTFSGRRHWELDGYTHGRLDNNRFVQVELRGVQGMDRIRVYALTLHGVSAEVE